MGGTWDLDPDGFLLRVFFLDFFFNGGCVLADWSTLQKIQCADTKQIAKIQRPDTRHIASRLTMVV